MLRPAGTRDFHPSPIRQLRAGLEWQSAEIFENTQHEQHDRDRHDHVRHVEATVGALDDGTLVGVEIGHDTLLRSGSITTRVVRGSGRGCGRMVSDPSTIRRHPGLEPGSAVRRATRSKLLSIARRYADPGTRPG